MIRRLIKKIALATINDPDFVSTRHLLDSLTQEEKDVLHLVEGFTMTSVQSIISLVDSTNYVIENSLAGHMVECGVWRGGSMMVMAEILRRRGDTCRDLYLYDTFEGMTVPSELDARFDGKPAKKFFDENMNRNGEWCRADINDVSDNLARTGYPSSKIRLIKGKVEETIPAIAPDEIALLRLDTDWYESTRHELEHLYPRLVSGGVLIIDDYGHWTGARAAADEYFSQLSRKPFLHRIDYSGRLLIKP